MNGRCCSRNLVSGLPRRPDPAVGRRDLRCRAASLALYLISFAAIAAPAEVTELLARFQAESSFWRQQEIGELLAKTAKPRDLSPLEPWLAHRDRRIRCNVAYLFARVGDRRGLATIEAVLADESPDRRVEWQGGSLISEKNGEDAMQRYLRSPQALSAQIRTDRYYAVALLGRLRDPAAVPRLLPLLADDTIDYHVAWALGEIGDPRAVPALMGSLADPDAHVRGNAIRALAKLRAREAVPALTALFGDSARPSAGERIPVGEIARQAVDDIRNGRVRR